MTVAATRIAASLVLISAALNGGCSFVFARGPKRDGPGRYEAGHCTSSAVAPAVDGAIGTLTLLETIDNLAASTPSFAVESLSRERRATIDAGLTALLFASMFYGWATVTNCREHDATILGPGAHPELQPTRAERISDEAAEEAAVQAQLKAKAAAEAADARAAGDAAKRANDSPAAAP